MATIIYQNNDGDFVISSLRAHDEIDHIIITQIKHDGVKNSVRISEWRLLLDERPIHRPPSLTNDSTWSLEHIGKLLYCNIIEDLSGGGFG